MFARFLQYAKETGQEMRRVTWPSRGELRESTLVVITTVAVVTFFIFLVDQVLSFIQKKLILMN
jgi:preprotein translocase subunit SecE